MRGLFGRSRQSGTATSDETGVGTPLESLLDEMRDLRLTLAADLTAAAGAAEAGADDVAADIVEADRIELARFARVADQRLERLQRLATAGPEAPRWRRRLVVSLPAIPVVGAMALSAAAATGALPVPGVTHDNRPPAAVGAAADAPSETLAQLVDVLDANPSASQVIAAASKLHRQLRQLMASSSNDPGKTAQIAELLRMEQSLLMRTQPPGVDVVLSATRKLAARLVGVTNATVKPTAVPSLESFDDSRKDRKNDTTPATSPSPSPSKSTSSPKPTVSPSSEPSSSTSPGTDPFPHIPNG